MLGWQDAASNMEGRERSGKQGVYFQVGENAKSPNLVYLIERDLS